MIFATRRGNLNTRSLLVIIDPRLTTSRWVRRETLSYITLHQSPRLSLNGKRATMQRFSLQRSQAAAAQEAAALAPLTISSSLLLLLVRVPRHAVLIAFHALLAIDAAEHISADARVGVAARRAVHNGACANLRRRRLEDAAEIPEDLCGKGVVGLCQLVFAWDMNVVVVPRIRGVALQKLSHLLLTEALNVREHETRALA